MIGIALSILFRSSPLLFKLGHPRLRHQHSLDPRETFIFIRNSIVCVGDFPLDAPHVEGSASIFGEVDCRPERSNVLWYCAILLVREGQRRIGTPEHKVLKPDLGVYLTCTGSRYGLSKSRSKEDSRRTLSKSPFESMETSLFDLLRRLVCPHFLCWAFFRMGAVLFPARGAEGQRRTAIMVKW